MGKKAIGLIIAAIVIVVGTVIVWENYNNSSIVNNGINSVPYVQNPVTTPTNISPSNSSPPSATPVSVSIQNFAFSPNSVTVPVGAKMIWTQYDSVEHQIVADDGTFSSNFLKEGDTFSFVFNTPGRYTYHCSIHPSMQGVIVVQ